MLFVTIWTTYLIMIKLKLLKIPQFIFRRLSKKYQKNIIIPIALLG